MTKDTNFYPLNIQQRVQETPDTVTLYFDVPQELREKFRYQAGQYLNLRFFINDTEYRRAYSLSTSPNENAWGVTIKMVNDGIISTFILDHLRTGDTVDVMPPEGLFTLKANPERRRVYYFFAAGSGITPLLSQLKLLLEEEPMSRIHLYYGSRDQESVIFKAWLDEAAIRYAGQLTVDYILSQPKSTGFLGGILGKKRGLWFGDKGRIDGENVTKYLEKYPPYGVPAAYHICGPGPMIVDVIDTLEKAGIPKESIHTEYFTPATEKKDIETIPEGSYLLTATLRGQKIEIPIHDRTILHTLEDAGYDPPYSCTSGTCSTCMAKLISGKVNMEHSFALTDQDIADGFVLTCQAHPVDGNVEVDYDY